MDFYHCLNRGTDKRQVAMDDRDRRRFVLSLYEMNDARPVENTARGKVFDLGGRTDDRVRLVDVHAWCLMGNHYHLLLSDSVEGGISTFLMKLNVGYTKYFNARYKRSGVLFQGKTKRVPVVSDRQFLYILPYIHLNPLDFMKGGKEWRTQCVVRPSGALKWVTEYRWSSYKNYAGDTEYAEILKGSELFADRNAHMHEMERFLKIVPDSTFAELNLE
jgi:putative transposase